jgi:hypothetical protein
VIGSPRRALRLLTVIGNERSKSSEFFFLSPSAVLHIEHNNNYALYVYLTKDQVRCAANRTLP